MNTAERYDRHSQRDVGNEINQLKINYYFLKLMPMGQDKPLPTLLYLNPPSSKTYDHQCIWHQTKQQYS